MPSYYVLIGDACNKLRTFFQLVEATQPNAKVEELMVKMHNLTNFSEKLRGPYSNVLLLWWLLFIFTPLCVHMCMCACVHALMCTLTLVWMLEGNVWESILSFYCMVSGDWTQVIRISSKCFYLLGHLARPFNYYYYHFKFRFKLMFFKFPLKTFIK